MQAFLHAYWVTGATAGAVLGMAIHLHLPGLDFAMTALFAVLAIDAFRARRDLPTPVLALACALVARLIVPGQMLLVAFALLTAGLLTRHACHAHHVRHTRHPRHPRRSAETGAGAGTGTGTETGAATAHA